MNSARYILTNIYNGDGTKQEPVAEELPQTQTVFTQAAILPSDHTFVQQGYFAVDIDDGCPHMGLPIPSGHILKRREDKSYYFEPEDVKPSEKRKK